MKRYVFLLLFVFTPLINVCSQNLTEDFKLLMPETKVKSVYAKLTVIDSRIDTTNMGFVQKGAFNDKALLKTKIRLKKQIEDVFKGMIATEFEPVNELVLNLRDFRFTETTNNTMETGYCCLRAELFSKQDTVYHKIAAIDSIYTVTDKEVSKLNIKNGSDKLIDFLVSNVTAIKSGPEYTYKDILNIVALEKRKIPVYNTSVYKNGIYQTYDKFKNMSSAAAMFEFTRNSKGRITKLERVWSQGRAEVKPSDIYCVVEKGKIYMASGFGFDPVEFRNDDFYFKRTFDPGMSTGGFALMSTFGLVGGIVASYMDKPFEVEMKIDYLDGHAVFLRKTGK